MDTADLTEYRSLSTLNAHGTLGLITLAADVFLCVVTGSTKVASVRPGENVSMISSVEFRKSDIFLKAVFALVLDTLLRWTRGSLRR